MKDFLFNSKIKPPQTFIILALFLQISSPSISNCNIEDRDDSDGKIYMEDNDCCYSYWLIVIQPCPGLSTAQVFSLWHESAPADRPDTDKALQALETGDLNLLCSSIGNVLQPVSEKLRPEIGEACNVLISEGAQAARMTGSGSAVFGVFRSPAVAEKAYKRIAARYKTVFLCHTQHDSVRIMEE